MEDLKVREFISISYGVGYGDGYGYGNGYGNGKKSINGMKICTIDNIPTILTLIKGNIAKGYILNGDLSLTPCYVVKTNNLFAHGRTLKEAQRALQEKLFEDMNEDERIEMFITEFPTLNTMVKNQELFDWHNKLTGSCLLGREQFCKNNGINLNGSMLVYDFIELTKDSYGSEIIKKLAKRYDIAMNRCE